MVGKSATLDVGEIVVLAPVVGIDGGQPNERCWFHIFLAEHDYTGYRAGNLTPVVGNEEPMPEDNDPGEVFASSFPIQLQGGLHT